MNDITLPPDAPPTYGEATGASSSSSSSRPQQSAQTSTSGHLAPASAAQHRRRVSENGIPAAVRRSMEDEQRPLPTGWVRQYDAQTSHQFFVNTKVDPPRSIWHHPYDDEQYLSTLSPEERSRIRSANDAHSHSGNISDAESIISDDGHDHKGSERRSSIEKKRPTTNAGEGDEDDAGVGSSSRPGPSSSTQTAQEKPSVGRRLKDKLTGSTHEEREAKRKKRAEEEAKAYEAHRRIREAMNRAIETGQPQKIGTDRDGKDLFIEPPEPGYGSGYGSGYGPGYGYGYGGQSYRGVNPYSSGPYTNPNARFIRPDYPYSRPYGYGYGGGIGPLGLGLGGGLLGGLLLGDIFAGGF